MKTINRIDVRDHIFPKEYIMALKEAGVEKNSSVDFLLWPVNPSFSKMKKNRTITTILSID